MDVCVPQARSVVLGMLHGTQSKLEAAWEVFVPAGKGGQLSHAEWKPVLHLITGGLGMPPSEVEQLFSLFDTDGSGALDYAEFCEVLAALPLHVHAHTDVACHVPMPMSGHDMTCHAMGMGLGMGIT